MSTKGKANFGVKTSAAMGTTDDIVRRGKQAREDAMNAMMENGMVPWAKHIDLEDQAAVEALYQQAATMRPHDIIIYRIPRDIVEGGQVSGACCAMTLQGLPEAAHGRVWLSFDGWADDPRELFEIMCVREWCRGFLFVSVDQPWQDHAKRVLTIMFDEDAEAFKDGQLVNQAALEAAGGIWLCSTAFAPDVYARDPRSPSGWSRDYTLSHGIREWLIGRANPPT
jgi:hypothetical protein